MSPASHTRPVVLRGLLRSIVLLVVLLCAGFFGIVLWGAYSVVDRLCSEAINGATRQIDVELDRFFGPVERNLAMAHGWAQRGALDPADVEGMNRRFMPLLESYPQISSMLVASPDGVEYMLLRSGDEWRNRSTDVVQRPGVTYWTTWAKDGRTKVAEETKEIDYDPRKRPWFQGAMVAEPGSIHWTEPYKFFTTKDPGITASSRTKTPNGELIVAFDVMLLDVSGFTTSLDVSPHGKAVVLTDELEVLGLPRAPQFETRDQMRGAVLQNSGALGVPGIVAAVENWKDEKAARSLQLKADGEPWLAAFRPHALGARTLWIGAAVPAADFKGEATMQRIALLLLAILGVLAGTFLAAEYTRRSAQAIKQAVDLAHKQLGQYRLEKKIGEGGMGAVYRASHVLMRRATAVKLLRPDRASPEFIKRFEREVRLSCRLTHPNTIAIYDYGRTPDGTFYYAMELLNGVSLAKFLDAAGPLPEGRAIYLLRQICESLREAHGVGLIHRDIKPGNIHICERGGEYDFIKVLDFGLVKDTSSTDDQQLTQESSYGTPGFVAPEAIRDSSKATALSDVYAVGTVGYALLTAQTIFIEKNRIRMLTRQLKEDPEPPSVRLGRALSSDLESIVMRCLSRDPSARPQSMQDILDALEACRASGDWTPADARSWWARHPNLLKGQREETLDEDDAPTINVDVQGR